MYAIADDGSSRRVGELHPIGPRGLVVDASFGSGAYSDLPWFLHDVRPSGYLGQAIPRRHPELGAPSSVNDWSADDVLRYTTAHADDLVGNIVLGDAAFERYMRRSLDAVSIDTTERAAAFAERAREALTVSAGYSAGGEQPKFLVTVDGLPRLVKFSPLATSPAAQRVADLLLAEHLANETLRDFGETAATSVVIRHNGQSFLQVDRFDRTSSCGRRGLLSLAAFDHEYVASRSGWSAIARALHEQRLIDAQLVRRVRFRDLFGAFIANTDRHTRNLSFFVDGLRIVDLTPSYDMSPWMFAPVSNEVPERIFTPPMVSPLDSDVAHTAFDAAMTYWRRLEGENTLSDGFRTLASTCRITLEGARSMLKLLPHN